MLTKLLKHEFKAVSRFLIPIHIALLLTSVIGRFTFTIHISYLPKYILPFLVALYILVLMTVCVGTYILIAIRFYKSLFTDEGYLNFTLPISPGQHLICKTITGALWCIIDFGVIVASVWLLCITPKFLNNLPNLNMAFQKQLDISFSEFFWIFIILYFIELLFAPLYIYVCIALGHLFSSHRVLGAIILYFVLTGLLQIISLVFMFAGGYLPYILTAPRMGSAFFHEYIIYAFSTGGVAYIVIGIVSYAGTYYIIKNKLNLN